MWIGTSKHYCTVKSEDFQGGEIICFAWETGFAAKLSGLATEMGVIPWSHDCFICFSYVIIRMLKREWVPRENIDFRSLYLQHSKCHDEFKKHT